MMNSLDLMRMRLEYQGGVKQEDRMIHDKYRTFLKTLQFSYQGCDVQLVQPYKTCYKEDPLANQDILNRYLVFRALINPDKLKQDYDDKILSIDYATGFGPGDIFKWKAWNKKVIGKDEQEREDNSTYWIIYLQSLTEDAYFRGEIRRCRHIIKFKDKDGMPKYTWAAIKGPVETTIESIQKNQERIDVPNLSLNIIIPRNEDTLQAFDRYMRFLFAGRAWKVQTHDSISTKNIIEVTASEDYINEDTDDVENELVDGLVIEPIDPNPPADDSILGETFILPKMKMVYEVNHPGGCWCAKSCKEDAPRPPVYVEPIEDSDGNKVEITWMETVSGQFILTWTDGTITLEKTIIVESLF